MATSESRPERKSVSFSSEATVVDAAGKVTEVNGTSEKISAESHSAGPLPLKRSLMYTKTHVMQPTAPKAKPKILQSTRSLTYLKVLQRRRSPRRSLKKNLEKVARKQSLQSIASSTLQH